MRETAELLHKGRRGKLGLCVGVGKMTAQQLRDEMKDHGMKTTKRHVKTGAVVNTTMGENSAAFRVVLQGASQANAAFAGVDLAAHLPGGHLEMTEMTSDPMHGIKGLMGDCLNDLLHVAGEDGRDHAKKQREVLNTAKEMIKCADRRKELSHFAVVFAKCSADVQEFFKAFAYLSHLAYLSEVERTPTVILAYSTHAMMLSYYAVSKFGRVLGKEWTRGGGLGGEQGGDEGPPPADGGGAGGDGGAKKNGKQAKKPKKPKTTGALGMYYCTMSESCVIRGV